MIFYENKIMSLQEIIPYDRNARKHDTKQIKQIMESIKEFGFTNPLLLDEKNNLIAGHGRLEAVKQLNKIDYKDRVIDKLPCIIIKGLNETQKKALRLADNQIALNSSWDTELLKDEILQLQECNFDIELLGFNDLNFVLQDAEQNKKELEIVKEERYTLCIEFDNELSLQDLYNSLKQKGYKCKIITF